MTSISQLINYIILRASSPKTKRNRTKRKSHSNKLNIKRNSNGVFVWLYIDETVSMSDVEQICHSYSFKWCDAEKETTQFVSKRLNKWHRWKTKWFNQESEPNKAISSVKRQNINLHRVSFFSTFIFIDRTWQMSCIRYILIVSDVKKSNQNDNLTEVDLNMHGMK